MARARRSLRHALVSAPLALALTGCALLIGADDPAYEPDSGADSSAAGADGSAGGAAGQGGGAGQGGADATPESGQGGASGSAGACGAGTEWCGTCVNTQSDPNHCGYCDHYCGSANTGACTAGVCQPFVFHTLGSQPFRLALMDGDLYWITLTGEVGRAHVDPPHAPETIVEATGHAPSFFAVGWGRVAWVTTVDDAGPSSRIRYFEVANPNNVVTSQYSVNATGLTLDGEAIWYSEQDGRIDKWPYGGYASLNVLNRQSPRELSGNGSELCWLEALGKVVCWAPGPGAPWEVADGGADATDFALNAQLTVHDAWWLVGGENGSLHRAGTAPPDGGVEPTLLFDTLRYPTAVFPDGEFVLFGVSPATGHELRVINTQGNPPDIYQYKVPSKVIDIVTDQPIFYILDQDNAIYRFTL